MSLETKQLHALSRIYKEAVYGGAKKEAPKDTRMVVTAADKKANTKAYQNLKAGVKGYKAADHMKEEKAKKDYDGDGKVESGSKEHAGVVHNAIQKKKGGKADGQDTRKEDVEVVEKLVESGKFTDVEIAKITNIQEADIADILARLDKKRISKGGDPDESPLGKKTGRAMKAQQDKQRKKAGM